MDLSISLKKPQILLRNRAAQRRPNVFTCSWERRMGGKNARVHLFCASCAAAVLVAWMVSNRLQPLPSRLHASPVCVKDVAVISRMDSRHNRLPPLGEGSCSLMTNALPSHWMEMSVREPFTSH